MIEALQQKYRHAGMTTKGQHKHELMKHENSNGSNGVGGDKEANIMLSQ